MRLSQKPGCDSAAMQRLPFFFLSGAGFSRRVLDDRKSLPSFTDANIEGKGFFES